VIKLTADSSSSLYFNYLIVELGKIGHLKHNSIQICQAKDGAINTSIVMLLTADQAMKFAERE
jgi:hypothetical protein